MPTIPATARVNGINCNFVFGNAQPPSCTRWLPAVVTLAGHTGERTSNMAKNLFLYMTFHFFPFAYQTLITIFGSPTFIYSQRGFYKYILFSFFHLFLQKSFEKGTENQFPLTLMQGLSPWIYWLFWGHWSNCSSFWVWWGRDSSEGSGCQ